MDAATCAEAFSNSLRRPERAGTRFKSASAKSAAARGERADEGKTDQTLVIDLHGVRRGIGHAEQSDRQAVAGAKLRGGSGDGDLRVGGADTTVGAAAGHQRQQSENTDGSGAQSEF